MKKRLQILLIPVFLVSISAAYAQTGFGVKAGANISGIHFDDDELHYDDQLGWHAGLFMRHRFGFFGVQPEVLIFTQRGDLEHNLLGSAEEKLTYLSIPIMFKFYPAAGFNIQAGPQIGFLIGGEREYDTFLGVGGTVDIQDEYKSTDVAGSVGIGYDTESGLGVDLRYNFGLTDINESDNGGEAKSSVFVISLGWNFVRD